MQKVLPECANDKHWLPFPLTFPWSEQRLFVENVYNEVQGNELQLATDTSCSLVLEKLLKVSDAFQLRVLTDKLSGQ